MSALPLKTILADAGITHAEVARAVGCPRSTLSTAINRGVWPVRDAKAVRGRIADFLATRGLPASGAFARRKEKAPKRANASRPVVPTTSKAEGDDDMVINKPTLHHATRQHFGLRGDPFASPIQPDDIYLSRDMRGVLEAMRETAVRPGGFLGVIGESGGGKSVLTHALLDKLTRAEAPVTIIKPMVLRSTDKMEVGKAAGKPITTQFIGDAIMEALAPGVPIRTGDYARQRQLERTLIESSRGGRKHLVLIEEAHDLSRTMLKHLKRLLEVCDGMMPTLSVLLVAQPELLLKLDPNDRYVRDVVARLELITLPPLDNDLVPYLKHRFTRIGAELEAVIDSGAIDALRERMTVSGRGRRAGSTLYPLHVANALTVALNAAADLGAPKVTRDLIVGGAA